MRDGDAGEGIPYIYMATDNGTGGLGFYSTWSLYDDSDIVAWSTNKLLNSTNPFGAIYINAGQYYDLLSKISCSVEFKPKEFNITVDKTQKTIRVSRGSNFVGALDQA